MRRSNAAPLQHLGRAAERNYQTQDVVLIRRKKTELRLVDQAVMDGVEREFEAIGNTEFVEDVVEVVFDGLLADEELFADFLVAETLSDELHNFFFAIH